MAYGFRLASLLFAVATSADAADGPRGRGGGGPGTVPRAELTVLSWNVHHQCGTDPGCRSRAVAALGALVAQAHPKPSIVAIIELTDASGAAFDLTGQAAFQGWRQVGGKFPCRDAVALLISPEWTLLGAGTGCLRSSGDGRAFAVAQVSRDSQVNRCKTACVVGLHATHPSNDTQIVQAAQDTIRQKVCGPVTDECTVALGDWNRDSGSVPGLWSRVIGQPSNVQSAPDDVTCCWARSGGNDRHQYDHVATNIAGASLLHPAVFPFQVQSEEEHHPIMASIQWTGNFV